LHSLPLLSHQLPIHIGSCARLPGEPQQSKSKSASLIFFGGVI
jgi:hypothetical protein